MILWGPDFIAFGRRLWDGTADYDFQDVTEIASTSPMTTVWVA